MSETILDSLREPDIKLLCTERYYSVTLWVKEGIILRNNEYALISRKHMDDTLNRLANDENYPYRQQILDFLVEHNLLV